MHVKLCTHCSTLLFRLQSSVLFFAHGGQLKQKYELELAEAAATGGSAAQILISHFQLCMIQVICSELFKNNVSRSKCNYEAEER